MKTILKKGVTILFVIAINSIYANTTKTFYQDDFKADAKIEMDYSTVHVATENMTNYEVLVWDTETGESKLYHYDYQSSKFELYEDDYQLPKIPLENVTGAIMMDYSSVHLPTENMTKYEVLVWDTNTGISKLYFFDYKTMEFIAYEDKIQLPKYPLDNTFSDIMMDYTVLHIPNENKTYYEILVWGTKTGESKLYFFDYGAKKFNAYVDSVQLPKHPLNNTSGDVMMDYIAVHDPNQNTTYYEVLIWDTKTGSSKLYYFSYDSNGFVAYEEEVQLPKYPLNNVSGDVFMNYTSVYDSKQSKLYYEILVWDNKTGASKLYFYDHKLFKFKVYSDNAQLPKYPINNPSGDVMMNYFSTYVPSEDKLHFEALVWDTHNGESILYYYDFDKKKFIDYGSYMQLPMYPLN